MMDTSPLILVQFLKDSMLEALMAMVLTRAPTPTPSQAGGRQTLVKLRSRVQLQVQVQSPGPGLYLWDTVRHTLYTAGRRPPPLRTTRRCRCGHTSRPSPRSYLSADGRKAKLELNFRKNGAVDLLPEDEQREREFLRGQALTQVAPKVNLALGLFTTWWVLRS